MRNMSFSMTTEQIRNRSKTVTRRFGWAFLKAGDLIQACVKCQGLGKGKKIEKICVIRVVSVMQEPLNSITKEECILEGFPKMEPAEFVVMLCDHYGIQPDKQVNRIEFEYVGVDK